MESNIEITKYKPPFVRPSFIKLDALYVIPKENILKSKVLCKGRKINPKELTFIKNQFNHFKNTHKILSKVCTGTELIEGNEKYHNDLFKEEAAVTNLKTEYNV